MTDDLAIARELIEAGAPVFVAKARPETKAGFALPLRWEQTAPDVRALEAWRPGDALCMVTGRLFDVLDADPRNGGDWSTLANQGMLPSMIFARVATCSGGEHLYVAPMGVRKKTEFKAGIDVQAGREGTGHGFVFLPGTIRRSKATGEMTPYAWIQEPDVSVAEYDEDTLGDEAWIRLRDAVRAAHKSDSAPAPEPAIEGLDEFAPLGTGTPSKTFTEAKAKEILNEWTGKVTAGREGSGFNDLLNQAAMRIGHFIPEFTTRAQAESALRRAVTKVFPAGPDHEDLATIRSGLDAGQSDPYGRRADPAEGAPADHVLPGWDDPMAVARALAARVPEPWSFWKDDHYRWTGSHWEIQDESHVRQWIYHQTEHAKYWAPPKRKDEGPELAGWKPNTVKVGRVLDALSVGVILDKRKRADQVVAFKNGVYDLETGALSPHRPDRFNLHALPFDYDPSAQCPAWLAFLDSILPGDQEAHALLAEWFGYVVSGRTGQQKMLSLVGPPRCGKGTVARVLQALLGEDANAAPSFDKLGTQFGEQTLINKSLAVMSDVRWNGRNAPDAVPVLLAITGEDARTIARKNRTDWTGTLGVRFMCMSNDVPTFKDSSGALANRMLHVQIKTTFLGREDLTLGGRLFKELPGILNWALAGLKELDARGHFAIPASARALAEEVEANANPIRAFLESGRVEAVAGAETQIEEVLSAYRNWCSVTGQKHEMETRGLSRALKDGTQRDEVPLTTVRRGSRNNRPTYVVGLRLTPRSTWSSFPTF